MPDTLFISDLHLDPERPAITDLFLDFLANRAIGSEAIYILGDLFEAWIGDDDTEPMNQTVCQSLKACVTAGTAIFIMHGNRDFLLGDRFAEQSGCVLLDDPTGIELYGRSALLMHGDLLCTDDTGYMDFRKMVRDPAWQQNLLAKPLDERRRMALQTQQHEQRPIGLWLEPDGAAAGSVERSPGAGRNDQEGDWVHRRVQDRSTPRDPPQCRDRQSRPRRDPG